MEKKETQKDIKRELSEAFAIRIVNCYDYLNRKNEFIISKQMLRSGTSIGANIAEAAYAESHDDFIHKLAIAQKEASETHYWLRLLHKTGKLENTLAISMQEDCMQILRLLSQIIRSAKAKKN